MSIYNASLFHASLFHASLFHWDGYYDVVKSCLENEGKEVSWKTLISYDPVFAQLQILESATKDDFREIIENFPDKAQNKLNSKVLDVILSATETQPMQYESKEQNIMISVVKSGELEAVKFYTTFLSFAALEDGFSAACRYGYLHIVKFFLEECKVNINVNDGTALSLASRMGHFEVFKFLYDQGLNSHNLLVDSTSTPNVEIFKFILNHKVKIEEVSLEELLDCKFNDTIIYIVNEYGVFEKRYYASYISIMIRTDNAKLLRFFCERGTESWLFPYHLVQAASEGYKEIVQILLEYKVSVSSEYHKCIRIALENNHLEIAKLLMQHA